MGSGGSSRGRLWNCGLTDRLPLTGIVARLGAKAAGCSLLSTLFCLREVFLPGSLNSGKGLPCVARGVIEKSEVGVETLCEFGIYLPEPKFHFFSCKFRPILSRMTLKKHSTSSVLLALGCSGFRPFIMLSCHCHSRPLLVIKATRVSLENPRTLLRLLHII